MARGTERNGELAYLTIGEDNKKTYIAKRYKGYKVVDNPDHSRPDVRCE